jgi:hypothetical protein
MTQTRWYHGGANQRRSGKPCTPPPACKDWEHRHWLEGYKDASSAIDLRAKELLDSVPVSA